MRMISNICMIFLWSRMKSNMAYLSVKKEKANSVRLSELVGADAKEVERGLKSEARIGTKAYLSPGGPYAGGTLARDIETLGVVSKAGQLVTPMLSSVRASNDEQYHCR